MSELSNQEQIEIYTQMAELEDRLGHEQSADDYRRRIKKLSEPEYEPGLYKVDFEVWGKKATAYFQHDGQTFLNIYGDPSYTIEETNITRVRTLGDDDVVLSRASLQAYFNPFYTPEELAEKLRYYADTVVEMSKVGVHPFTASGLIKMIANAVQEADSEDEY